MVKLVKKFLDRGKNLNKLIDTLKNMFLDLFSMGRGFLYGFIMVGLFILIVGILLYGIFYLKNLLFLKVTGQGFY